MNERDSNLRKRAAPVRHPRIPTANGTSRKNQPALGGQTIRQPSPLRACAKPWYISRVHPLTPPTPFTARLAIPLPPQTRPFHHRYSLALFVLLSRPRPLPATAATVVAAARASQPRSPRRRAISHFQSTPARGRIPGLASTPPVLVHAAPSTPSIDALPPSASPDTRLQSPIPVSFRHDRSLRISVAGALRDRRRSHPMLHPAIAANIGPCALCPLLRCCLTLNTESSRYCSPCWVPQPPERHRNRRPHYPCAISISVRTESRDYTTCFTAELLSAAESAPSAAVVNAHPSSPV